MSADCWRICPKCQVELSAKRDEENAAIDAKMMSMGGDEFYQEKTAIHNKYIQALGEETLREDYEIRTGKDGEFHVGYSCSCERCGFEFSFQHTQKTYPKPEEPES